MLRRFVILPFILCSLFLSAQPKENKGYFGISAGLSLPVAEFASTDPGEENAGFAKTGFNAMISTNVLIKDFVGFTGLFGYCRNPYNEQAIVDYYNQQLPDEGFQFTAGPYDMVNILGGAFIAVPQGILDINFKGYIGLSVASIPATSSNSPGNMNIILETVARRANGFAYGGGINLMFYTGSNITILLDAIYIQTKQEFNAVEIRVYENGQLLGLSATDIVQKYQLVSLSAGIGFTF